MNRKQKSSKRRPSCERVEIWNTFFQAAYSRAIKLKQADQPDFEAPNLDLEGGALDTERSNKLFLLTSLILAAEARASHLIEECVCKAINAEQAESLLRMNFKQQWGLLPLLFQGPEATKVDFSSNPYKVVGDLRKIRDDLFHVNYQKLCPTLDGITNEKAIQYVVEFWDAMENMNALLGRIGQTKPRLNVLAKVDSLR